MHGYRRIGFAGVEQLFHLGQLLVIRRDFHCLNTFDRLGAEIDDVDALGGRLTATGEDVVFAVLRAVPGHDNLRFSTK